MAQQSADCRVRARRPSNRSPTTSARAPMAAPGRASVWAQRGSCVIAVSVACLLPTASLMCLLELLFLLLFAVAGSFCSFVQAEVPRQLEFQQFAPEPQGIRLGFRPAMEASGPVDLAVAACSRTCDEDGRRQHICSERSAASACRVRAAEACLPVARSPVSGTSRLWHVLPVVECLSSSLCLQVCQEGCRVCCAGRYARRCLQKAAEHLLYHFLGRLTSQLWSFRRRSRALAQQQGQGKEGGGRRLRRRRRVL